MILRNGCSASSIPAAVDLRHMSPDCQRLTLRLVRRVISMVGRRRAAVPRLRAVVCPPPPAEPDVRVPTHPALHRVRRWFDQGAGPGGLGPVRVVARGLSGVAHGVGMRWPL
jgi:hypothetical protein